MYPVWLSLQLVFHIVALTLDGLSASKHSGEPSANYLMYIHNWCYLLLILSNVIDLVVNLYVHICARHILQERESETGGAEIVMRNRTAKISFKTMGEYYTVRWYMKVTWVFFTISTVSGLTITILYLLSFYFIRAFGDSYGILGTGISETQWEFGTIAFMLINGAIVVLHLFISAKPFKLLHFYMPWAVYFVYVLFSVVYQKRWGDFVYRVLDWNQIYRTFGISAIVLVVLLPLVHLLVYAIIALRVRIGEWCLIKCAYRRWRNKKKVRPSSTQVDVVREPKSRKHKKRIRENRIESSNIDETVDEDIDYTKSFDQTGSPSGGTSIGDSTNNAEYQGHTDHRDRRTVSASHMSMASRSYDNLMASPRDQTLADSQTEVSVV
ncbi:uncharacterized protein LOC127832204 [Dreissena polymorpha]|uniref:Protein rolling stone n=1 Tax=Dreissena polymorpha TaxID=45954 RepID=A0A9D4JM58_DREPO|nr:uncharacterized protein LOC127832204 [Dreissena polymorpha]KAH3817190.1 hypothetical protein DPMN_118720 [Dreissena polymorpha]